MKISREKQSPSSCRVSAVALLCFLFFGGLQAYAESALPRIAPDYAGIVIPPNIAPLNFAVQEEGTDYETELAAGSGPPIKLRSGDGQFRFPAKRWRQLLQGNKGSDLRVAIRVRSKSGEWRAFQIITNRISPDPVDPYLFYRRLHPQFSVFGSGNIGIFQRNLENFEETTILEVKDRADGSGHCINCHTFPNRDPSSVFTLHLRSPEGKGMLLARDGNVSKVDLTAGYMSWHPSGRLLAFSRNKLSLFFHSTGETRDVYDAQSDLAIYRADSNTVVVPPAISRPDRQENWPMWSQDGQYLYFASTAGGPIEQFKSIRYDLMRVHYDLERDAWGTPETLLTAAETGHTLVEPRPSPDGRFLVFTMADYGHFPIYQTNADLYLLDLQTREHRKMELNSSSADTWHCWSSNGRWLVFSSKRLNRMMARPFFSHIDEQGHATKPFVLPQEDPAFYDTFLKTFNVPEFAIRPFPGNRRKLLDAVFRQPDLKPGGTTPAKTEQTDEASPVQRK